MAENQTKTRRPFQDKSQEVFTGNLLADPEVKENTRGTRATVAEVAIHSFFTRRDGTIVETYTARQVRAYNGRGVALGKMKKGDRVLVLGRHAHTIEETDSGVSYRQEFCLADEVTLAPISSTRASGRDALQGAPVEKDSEGGEPSEDAQEAEAEATPAA